MKFLKILSALICVGALSFVLAGCSQPNLAGTYDLYEIQGSNGTTHEEIEQLEKSGFALFINLNEDKTFDFIFVGTDFQGTWESEDGKNVTLTPESGSGLDMTDCTYADGKLTMTLYGETTVFEKGDAKNISDYL